MSDISKALDRLTNQGFSLDQLKKNELSIAFLSLRSAFRAWFSTYECFRWQLHIADPEYWTSELSKDTPASEIKYTRQYDHPTSYFEQYSETIFHFQHFIELVIKDILRKENELLVSDAARYPSILWKLTKNEEISEEERQKLYSVEFNEALERIVDYIANNNIDNAKYGFLADGKLILKKLNLLRNRLVHRGTFVLPYASLDEFIGKYLLPLLIAITELPEYKKHDNFWKYESLKCGIDPINSIYEEFQVAKVNFGKVAFLKELGRAAFRSPIPKHGLTIDDDGGRSRAELLASKEAENSRSEVLDVLTCPVCGSKSLARFFDVEIENPETGDGWLFTYDVQCFCCTFELTNSLKNAKDYGLELEDYWVKKDLE
jgi:hypothetical protein